MMERIFVFLFLIAKAISYNLEIFLYCIGTCRVYSANNDNYSLTLTKPSLNVYPDFYKAEIETNDDEIIIEVQDLYFAAVTGHISFEGYTFYIKQSDNYFTLTPSPGYFPFFDINETEIQQNFVVQKQFNLTTPIIVKFKIPKETEDFNKADIIPFSKNCYTKGFIHSNDKEYNFSKLFSSEVITKKIEFPLGFNGNVTINETEEQVQNSKVFEIDDNTKVKISIDSQNTNIVYITTIGTSEGLVCKGKAIISFDGCQEYNGDKSKCTKCIEKYFDFYNDEKCHEAEIGFFYDKNDQERPWKRCYKTCETCSIGGNSSIHNCNKCKKGLAAYKAPYRNFSSCYKSCAEIGLLEYFNEAPEKGKRTCALTCPDYEYFYDDTLCLPPGMMHYFGFLKIIEEKAMVRKCPEKYPFLKVDELQCVAKCSSDKKYEYIHPDGRKICINACPEKMIEGASCLNEDSISTCTNAQKFLDLNGSCVDNCTSDEAPNIDLDIGKCIKDIEGMFLVVGSDNKYVRNCKQYNYNYKQDLNKKKCLETCDVFYDEKLNICVEKCPNYSPYLFFENEKKVCKYYCDFLIKNGQCVNSCKNDTSSQAVPFTFEKDILDCTDCPISQGRFCLSYEPSDHVDIIDESEETDTEEPDPICHISCETCDPKQDNNLCFTCNNSGGYYEFPNDSGDNFKNCSKDVDNYYVYNNETWKKCYASCKKCSGDGSEDEQNCNSCLTNYIQNPLNKTQCYLQECTGKFYYRKNDSYYKCLEGDCPEEYKYLISGTQQCIDSCKNYKTTQNGENGENSNKKIYTSNLTCVEICPIGYQKNDSTYNCDPICDISCGSCKGGKEQPDKECITCNNSGGYYEFPNYNGDNFKNCSKDVDNYYVYNNETWKKCYASCKRCSGEGSEDEQNCNSCLTNYIQNPLNNKQCYKNCSGNFYYRKNDSYYKCLEGDCPEEYKYLISGTKQCINDCKNYEKCGKNCQTGPDCASNNVCINKKFYYSNLTCVENCSYGYEKNESSQSCVPICNISCEKCNIGKEAVEGKCISCNKSGRYYPFANESTNDYKYCHKDVDNYYVYNNETWKKCYASCKKCSGEGSEDEQNCNSCLTNYIQNSLNNEQCYKNCSGNFYYRKNDSYYKCLNDGCGGDYKYLISGTKQCINDCKNYEKCGENCITAKNCENEGQTCNKKFYYLNFTCFENCPSGYQINESTQSCELIPAPPIKNDSNTDILQDTLDNFISDAFSDPLTPENITTDDFTIQKFPSEKPPAPTKNTTSIDLSECIEILKKELKIVEVIVIKIDIYRNNSPINQVEYSLFDIKGNELNLTYCKGINVTINYVLSENHGINLTQLFQMKSYSDVDLLNSSDPFYQDVCIPHTSDDGTDMVIQDRQKDLYPNISLCDTGCIYDKVDIDTMQVSCKCNVKTEMSTEVTEPEPQEDMGNALFSMTNLSLFKCYKSFLNLKNWIKNVGFYLIGTLFVICLFLFFQTLVSFEITKGHLTSKMIKGETPPIKKQGNQKSLEKTQVSQSPLFSERIKLNKVISFEKIELLTGKNKSNYDALSFKAACQNDQRQLGKILFDTFASKIDLMQVFCYPEPYGIFSLTFSGYAFALSLEFTLNSFIFSDGIISNNYRSKNEMNMFTSILLSSVSNVISNAIIYVLFKVIAFANELEFIAKEKVMEKTKLQVINKYFKYIKLRIYAYFVVELVFEAVLFYYIIIFCVVYKNSQVNWIKDCLTGIAIDLGVSLGISIIVSVMRYIAIKGRFEKLYYSAVLIKNFKCIISL